MASKVSTPVVEIASDGPLPANRFKVVKIDQRLPGKTGLKGEDPLPVTYKRGRWTVTDFYDGPSCTPCNSSPTTPTPLATFTGPRAVNPSCGNVDGSHMASPPIVPGQGHPLTTGIGGDSSVQVEESKGNRVADQPDIVPCGVPNPPGLLSPEDRKTSLPNIPGALVLQSPAARLGRKTSLHDSHKMGFIVEPVLDPSDPIAPVPAAGQTALINPAVSSIGTSENSSSPSSSSSSSTADASSSTTASPSTSEATPMVTVVQAHPVAGAPAKPSNDTATVICPATVLVPPVVVVPKPVASSVPVVANAVTPAPVVVVTQKPPIAPPKLSDTVKTFPVTTENVELPKAPGVPLDQVANEVQNAVPAQPPKETPMEVTISPESTVSASDRAALTAAVEAMTTSTGNNTSSSPTDVSKVNVGGQTDHVTFVEDSLVGTAGTNSIASTAPQSVSIPLVSSVAIDNKIEQAMDLVKSHLMFAVREEVDVLKEKIVELLERIQLLETENAILKQAHQNQLGNQGTQSLISNIQLNTSPVPATLDSMEVSTVASGTTDAITGTPAVAEQGPTPMNPSNADPK